MPNCLIDIDTRSGLGECAIDFGVVGLIGFGVMCDRFWCGGIDRVWGDVRSI
jgi:hypothetical protein